MSKADEAALFREQSYISFLSALWQFPLHHAHCCLLYTSYAGFLSEVGDTVTLIAMSDMNGYDGLYFVQ